MNGDNGATLLIPRCGRCARWVSPPQPDCPDCAGELTPQPVSGRGEVFTYTVNRHPFNPELQLPYVIAIVQLEEQDDLRLVGNVVECDPDDVRIGLPVRYAPHDGETAPQFAPA